MPLWDTPSNISAVATTTIKLDSRLRDRLNEEARRDGVTVARVLEAMLEERDRARRFEALRAAIAATSAQDRASYEAETEEWESSAAD